MPIRLIAIDMDGTLLTDDLQIPSSAKAAIAAARARGVRVVPATGRMFVSALPYARQIGAEGPIIAYNGAKVVDLDGRVRKHHPVPPEEALALVDLAEKHDLCLHLYFEDQTYVRRFDEGAQYYASLAGVEPVVMPDLRPVARRGTTKALIVDDPAAVERWCGELSRRFAGRLLVTRSLPRFVEFMAAGVCKGVALAELAAELGLAPEEVMAIGDSYNDIDMLTYAGVGVALGNAQPAVKEMADWVSSANTDHGVARAIEKFVLAS
ncbi:MAG TPA: HAD family phosphatase [Firmicutes bacterium]|nr:HAD family phosphatase [Bacillota bacterium]